MALFTRRIEHLTEHLKAQQRRTTTETALMTWWASASVLNYLKKNDIERYRAIIQKLGLRKKMRAGRPAQAGSALDRHTDENGAIVRHGRPFLIRTPDELM